MTKAKPFSIPKREVWGAFQKVKANQGAAGVDGQSIAEFEADLANNLYRLWNRMSSGSYFPPLSKPTLRARLLAARMHCLPPVHHWRDGTERTQWNSTITSLGAHSGSRSSWWRLAL